MLSAEKERVAHGLQRSRALSARMQQKSPLKEGVPRGWGHQGTSGRLAAWSRDTPLELAGIGCTNCVREEPREGSCIERSNIDVGRLDATIDLGARIQM